MNDEELDDAELDDLVDTWCDLWGARLGEIMARQRYQAERHALEHGLIDLGGEG